MSRQSSVMTAIPYVNSTPHIGTLLSTLTGDVTARYLRMRGDDVWFQSGTDENGLKIKEAAERTGRPPGEFVADIAQRFIDIFKAFEISYDDFVRTTEPRHLKASQALFAQLKENGYIYEGVYEGWYDVSAETFFKEDELVEGKSPNGNEVRWVSDTNYFFKLSAFQDRLLDAYDKGEIVVVPDTRQNEVLSFIKQGLRDTCISRANPGWGIEVPGDPSQVIYVWFDAVINYLTSTGYPEAGWEAKWPPVVQWVGKDILTRFHATLWPAMLMGIGAKVPPVIAAHAWILLGGEKLSKSSGHVVEPIPLRDELAAKAGISPEIAVDAIRHYLIATMGYENDSTFTYEDFFRRYNNDLANDIGNALNRTLAMSHKFVGGIVPDASAEHEALTAISDMTKAYEGSMALFRLDHASSHAFDLVRFLNKYIDTSAPWAKYKETKLGITAHMQNGELVFSHVRKSGFQLVQGTQTWIGVSGHQLTANELIFSDKPGAGLVWVNEAQKWIGANANGASEQAQIDSDRQKLESVLYSMLLCIRAAEGMVRPIMPTVADAISAQLGLLPLEDFALIGTDASLPAGTVLSPPQPIFPRLDLATKQEHRPKPASAGKHSKVDVPALLAELDEVLSDAPNSGPVPIKAAFPESARIKPRIEKTMSEVPPAPVTTEITIEDFAKVKLRVGRIFEAAPLEGSDKLMVCQVVIGEEKRQIVAGIKANYTPEQLIGRQIVVCVNLKPAKLRGVESQGMLLAATDSDGGAILLAPEKEAPEGAPVK